jgi:hypothetical protein
MQFLLERCRRVPRVPWWFASLMGVWAVVVAAGAVLIRQSGVDHSLCHIRQFSGVPCPTCGTTRAVFALFSADLAGAIAFNPLVLFATIVLALIVAVRLIAARQITVRLSSREQWVVATALLVMVLLNWLYVLARHSSDE